MKGITGVSISVGSRRLFEVKYYGPIAAYRIDGGPRRWTPRPLANRRAGKAMASAVQKSGDRA